MQSTAACWRGHRGTEDPTGEPGLGPQEAAEPRHLSQASCPACPGRPPTDPWRPSRPRGAERPLCLSLVPTLRNLGLAEVLTGTRRGTERSHDPDKVTGESGSQWGSPVPGSAAVGTLPPHSGCFLGVPGGQQERPSLKVPLGTPGALCEEKLPVFLGGGPPSEECLPRGGQLPGPRWLGRDGQSPIWGARYPQTLSATGPRLLQAGLSSTCLAGRIRAPRARVGRRTRGPETRCRPQTPPWE